MASEPDKRERDLSAEDKLRAADRELAQLREVLASMDEIDALRKRDGKPESGEYGGYKREDVSAMIAELERRRRELLEEISVGSAAGAPAARERVTLSNALERLYTALSGNVERAKNEILREIRYSCRQDTAIYAELSARMDALADKVAEKVLAAGIDTDALARRMVAYMAGRSDAATIEALEKRIRELEGALAARSQEKTAEEADPSEEPSPLADGSVEAAAGAETADSEASHEDGEAPAAAEEQASVPAEAADAEETAGESVSEEMIEPEGVAEKEVSEEPAEAEESAVEDALEEAAEAEEAVAEDVPEVNVAEDVPEAEADTAEAEEPAAEDAGGDRLSEPEAEAVAAEEIPAEGEEVVSARSEDAAEGAEVDEKHTDEAEPHDQRADGEASEE